MSRQIVRRCLKAIAAMGAAAALSGCVVYPAYGPRYGYYYRSHPYYVY